MNRLVYILLFFLILTNGAKAQDAEFLLPGKIAIAEANNFLKKAKLIESENFVLYDFFTVYYHGEPGNTGFGSFSQAKHGDVPIIWTLSEPYGALDWWPCKQSLTDKIDSINIIVTSPEPYRTASNGVLVSEIISNGKRTMHWKHRYPIVTYLVAVAVTNYTDYSDFPMSIIKMVFTGNSGND